MASIRIIRKIVNRRLPSSLTSLTVGSSIGRDELSGKRLYSSSSICQATPRKNETVNPPEIKPKKRANEFSVDRSGLLKSEDLDFPNEFVEPVNRPDKEELTPLAIDLYSIINLKGPITLHEFMSEALNHTVHGYYQAKNTEKIGAKGDFVTSPEISQLFGEMLGIWIYSTWEAMGSPSTFHLIEFGPGKGTLMVDMLTVLRKFPKCLAAVEVHFVELSLRLRQVQYDSLQKKFSNKPETEFTNMTEVLKDQQRYEIEIEGTKVPLVWNSFFRQIPSDQPCIIIGQEFLDAFPVHQFIYTKKGWREKLVDIDRVIYNLDDDEEFDNSNNNNEPGEKKQPYPFHFRLVTSPRPTAAVQSLISSENPKVKQFRESLKTSGASFKSPDEAQLQEGDGLEIAPLALIQCEDVAMRITKAGGACLFIDYGEDFAQEDTLRGFKKHKQVPFLSEPGTVDITADVNFASCRKAAESKGAHVLPLMLQGQFLMNMGIVQRVQRLIEHPSVTDEDANFLVESMKKLVLPEEMGKRFKVLGIIHPTLVGKVYGF